MFCRYFLSRNINYYTNINKELFFVEVMGKRGDLKIFANRSGESFARDIINELNSGEYSYSEEIVLSEIKHMDFADGEYKPEICDSVRGCDCYLVQNCFDPTSERSVNDNLMESLECVDALKAAGAEKVTLIMPYHPFSRQDKSTKREPITMKLAADLISAVGVDNILTTDLHADQSIGFYNPQRTKIDNLKFSKILIPALEKIYSSDELKKLVVMGPDAGGAPRAKHYSNRLGTLMAYASKKRSYSEANIVEELRILGDIEGYNVFIIDDMIDTGGSMVKLVKDLKNMGALDIKLAVTHLLLNKDAVANLSSLDVDVMGSDSIPRKDSFWDENPNFKKISVASLYALAIHNLNNNLSLKPVYRA